MSGLGKRKKIIIGAIIGMAVLILSVGIYFFNIIGKLDMDDISEDEVFVNEELALDGFTNVALFGIDSREGELELGTRSDCIIVASLNNKTKEIRMVSVYRDTLLEVEENYLQKCNAAYSFGGPTQAINMLNKNLDLDIKDYVTVDFAAVANTIDLLGGIEIDVKPEEISTLNKYVTETARVAGKEAEMVYAPGVQILNGVQATTYARIRSTEGGDFTRTERQRLVIEKIVEKMQQSDLPTINKMINELFPTIKTSFTVKEILSYAKDFTKYEMGESAGFPFDKTTDTISGLGSIVIPVTLATNVELLHEFLYDVQEYVPSVDVNEISNKIISRVGQREAIDNEVLDNQIYEPTQEDIDQESNQFEDVFPETGNDDTEEENGEENDEVPDTELPVEKPESDIGNDNTNPENNGVDMGYEEIYEEMFQDSLN